MITKNQIYILHYNELQGDVLRSSHGTNTTSIYILKGIRGAALSRPCFILNIFLYVHSIKRSLFSFLLTRIDYCICNWSADHDDCFTF